MKIREHILEFITCPQQSRIFKNFILAYQHTRALRYWLSLTHRKRHYPNSNNLWCGTFSQTITVKFHSNQTRSERVSFRGLRFNSYFRKRDYSTKSKKVTFKNWRNEFQFDRTQVFVKPLLDSPFGEGKNWSKKSTNCHRLYYPDLAPCDFTLFLNISKSLDGQKFEPNQEGIDTMEAKKVVELKHNKYNTLRFCYCNKVRKI